MIEPTIKVAIDLETDQVNPYPLEAFRSDFRVRLMSVAEHSEPDLPAMMVLSDQHDMRAQLCALAGRLVTGWNLVFDITCLLSAGFGPEVRRIQWIDAMHLCRWVLNSQEKEEQSKAYALATVSAEILPKHPWIVDWLEHKDTGVFDAQRAAGDAGATLMLAQWAWEQMTQQQRKSALIEAQNLMPACEAWRRGIPVNLEKVRRAGEAADEELRHLEAHLELERTQLASPKQLADVLYLDWGLPVTVQTPKGDRSTSKEALTYLTDADPRALEILRWRKVNTVKTKFLDGIHRAAEHLRKPLMHPQPRIFSTYTGRYTYSSKQFDSAIGFALHQQPRGPEVRRMVLVPPGYRLVELDASGQEMRLMADHSEDETLCKVFQQGLNPHDVTGAAIGGLSYESFMARKAEHEESIVGPKGLRYCGKFVNLSCIARGVKVATDRGWVPIEAVRVTDLVWDGVEFVSHEGVVCRGQKHVIRKGSIAATADHQFLTKTQTWAAWGKVQSLDNLERRPPPEIGAIRSGKVQMWERKRDQAGKSNFRQESPVSQLCAYQAYAAGENFSEAISGSQGSMHQLKESVLSKLWGTWDRNAVRQCLRLGYALPSRLAEFGLPGVRHRQGRQLRALRTWQSEISLAIRKLVEYAAQPLRRLFRHSSVSVPSSSPTAHRFPGLHNTTNNCREMVSHDIGRRDSREGPSAQDSRVEVFDILECGPRNRFVIQGGLIAHNCQYRIGVRKLRIKARVDYDLRIDYPTANSWKRTYLDTYPGIAWYWETAVEKARKQGYAETRGGRCMKLTKFDPDDDWSTDSTAINFPIQGTGADMKELAIATINWKFPEWLFAWDLHDGLFFWVPESWTNGQILSARDELNRLDYEKFWGWTPKVPMVWDAAVTSTHWGEMEEIRDAH